MSYTADKTTDVSSPRFGPVRRLLGTENTLPRMAAIATVGIPLLVHFILTTPLLDWLIDDAGISFVYARNLANGHGLVSQPGFAPVEGYSNFLWVVLMVPFFLLGLFDPFITAKSLCLVLVGMTFYYIYKSVQRLSDSRYVLPFIVLTCLALNASFIVWTCSGLENPLLAALVALLFYQQLRWLDTGMTSITAPIVAAILVTGIAMTRPDGIVYVALPVVTLVLAGVMPRNVAPGSALRTLSAYTGSVIVLLGGFLLFRYLYFGDIVPNTYYVKGGPSLGSLVPALTLQGRYLTRFQDIAGSLLGLRWWWLIPSALVGLAVLTTVRRERTSKLLLLLAATFIAGFTYLIMPHDWMGEYRFATPLFGFLYTCLVLSGWMLLCQLTSRPTVRRIIGVALALAMIAQAAAVHMPRLNDFSTRKIVSFTRVARGYGERFNRYAEFLDLKEASFLVPDIGGTLYYSKLRIYDLAGLCDKTISRTRGKDQQHFYDYVFDTLQPTFIHTHGHFTGVSKFDDDPRFAEDYVAIREYHDTYVERVYKASRISGDFIRKDMVTDKVAKLDSLREGLVK